MDSVGDLEGAFDIVGGVFKSVDQRDGFAIGAGVASTGLSGLAGDCRCVRAEFLVETAESDPDSDGEGDWHGRGQTIGVGFGLVLDGRSESSQPDTNWLTGVRGGGEGMVNRVENRVENPSETWMNSSALDLQNNENRSQLPGPRRPKPESFWEQ